jgi:hypothetical protein
MPGWLGLEDVIAPDPDAVQTGELIRQLALDPGRDCQPIGGG